MEQENFLSKPLVNIISISYVLILFSYQPLFAQQGYPGAPPWSGAPKHPTLPAAPSYRNFVYSQKTNSASYSAAIYTFNDIAVFSYSDSTDITITNVNHDTVAAVALGADSFDTLSPGNGIYFISGNKPYAVLTGDAITSTSSGYFALDENGYGTGTKFNTWMMGGDVGFDPHFIIFAYDSGTSFSIINLATGDSLYNGIVDSTGYFDFPSANISSIQKKMVQVVSNNPVSVLSYTDQGYYVPSSNGTFAGNLFYGFSGYEAMLQNSITLSSYSDSNVVVITSLTNNDTLAIDTLNHWQVKTFGINADIFWKVKSAGTLTAANIPFEESWEDTYSFYSYLDEVADSTGKNIGTSFIVPTTQSDLSIFSYDDNNNVQVIQLGDTAYPYKSPVSVKDTILQSGGAFIFTSPVGDYVYRIQSGGRVSVIQSSAGAGASFVTVNGTAATGVIADKALPQNFVLYQNFPNPFNPTTEISYQVSVNSHVTLKVYDVLGREMATLVNEKQDAGTHVVEFDGSRFASGVYFYRLSVESTSGGHAGTFTDVKKLVLVK